MEKSSSIKNISKALIDFQGKVEKIKKDASNPFFKSKYATLSNILDVIQIPLIDSGLSVSQFPDSDDMLSTIIIHAESGEYMQSTHCMRPVKNDPQSIGSSITYARRYALGSILGLNIEDDDDGNIASTPAKKQPKNDMPWINPGSKEWIEAIKFLKGEGTIPKIKTKYRISTVNEEKLKEATL